MDQLQVPLPLLLPSLSPSLLPPPSSFPSLSPSSRWPELLLPLSPAHGFLTWSHDSHSGSGGGGRGRCQPASRRHWRYAPHSLCQLSLTGSSSPHTSCSVCVPPPQVRGGHSEAACYLLNKGADPTLVTESGDSALSVADSPRMKRLIRGKGCGEREGRRVQVHLSTDAWTEQSAKTTSSEGGVNVEKSSPISSPLSQPDKQSFFLTDRQISRSLDFETAELLTNDTPNIGSCGGCGLLGVVNC